MAKFTTFAPDDPHGTEHVSAPDDVARAICRRFGHGQRPVAVHPTEPSTYIYDPGNFYDGPTHVAYEATTGTFTFDGWSGRQTFPMVGPLQQVLGAMRKGMREVRGDAT